MQDREPKVEIERDTPEMTPTEIKELERRLLEKTSPMEWYHEKAVLPTTERYECCGCNDERKTLASSTARAVAGAASGGFRADLERKNY